MDGQPGSHMGPRLRGRRWRTALMWVGALIALALGVWVAIFGVYNPLGGP
jgi:hypothetical protein